MQVGEPEHKLPPDQQKLPAAGQTEIPAMRCDEKFPAVNAPRAQTNTSNRVKRREDFTRSVIVPKRVPFRPTSALPLTIDSAKTPYDAVLKTAAPSQSLFKIKCAIKVNAETD